MKAPNFDYHRATSLEEALGVLAERRGEARIMAGGQSLLASLSMRLSNPELMLDISQLDELKGITEGRKGIEIGALTRHVELLQSDVVRSHAPLVSITMPHIAHVAIRNRGTIGGSLSLADPAAELPAVCVALDAEFTLSSRSGKRVVPADDFFKGLYETECQEDEILTSIKIPSQPADSVVAFRELSRRKGDFAIVGLAAIAHFKTSLMSRKKSLSDIRLVYFGCEDRPRQAQNAGRVFIEAEGDLQAVPAAQEALSSDLNPMGSLEGRPDTKMHLARVLLGQVLDEIAGGDKPAE